MLHELVSLIEFLAFCAAVVGVLKLFNKITGAD